MILPARAPLEAHGHPLRVLLISLNSPVVTLESLPPGPASAAIAVTERGATLCVRSLRTGQVIFFTTGADLADDRRVAQDAALSFAESMGFFFDDDVVEARGEAGPGEAARLWCELCGDRLVASEPPRVEASEIVLPQGLPVARRPAPNPALVLSKFRIAAQAAP